MPYRLLVAAMALTFTITACVQSGGTPPPPSPNVGLSIGGLRQDQSLAGTIAVTAGGIGGNAQSVTFTLGGLTEQPDATGVAIFDTRSLADGAYTLEATATVGGTAVRDSVAVTVMNSLPSSGTAGAAGGALGAASGSIAVLPPGAVSSDTAVSVSDTSQAEILLWEAPTP